MEHKVKQSVGKGQLILQWICAVIWIIVVIVDLVCGQNLFLTIAQSIAALLFIAAAIVTTVRWRNQQPTDKEK